MRMILCCAMVAFLVPGVAADDEKIDTKKLVGKWQPKEENKKGKVTIEFSKDGKMTVTFSGKEDKIEGMYKVDGNKVTVRFKDDGKETTKTFTILKLTDAAMTTKDEDGKEEMFLRIKDK
jgi:uncharacterized protein (TIGR03066 family)